MHIYRSVASLSEASYIKINLPIIISIVNALVSAW